MKKKGICVIIAAAVLLIFAFVLSGCADNGGPSAKTVTVGTLQDIEKAVRDEYNFDVMASGVSEMPLVGKDPEGKFYPLVASYSTADSKVWTYTVKENLKWSDGREVTAEDIVFSLIYEGGLEKKTVFSETDETAYYDRYELSPDKLSVELTLKRANIKALSDMTTFRIRPKHIYDGKTEDMLTEADRRVTCGPYRLEEYNKEAGAVTFVKNDFYPETTNIDKVVYRLFKDADVMYSALMQGDIDYVWQYSSGVPTDYQKALEKSDNIKFLGVSAENCPAMLVFNNSTGLFADRNVRIAVSYALDYQKFNKYFGSEYAVCPNKSFVPSSHIGYKDTENLVFDTETAGRYMAAAGYKKSGAYWEKDGKDAEFRLTVNSGSKNPHTLYAEFVKTQLEEFGIKVKLDAVDPASFNAKTSNKFSGNNVTMEAAVYGFTVFGMNTLGANYINGKNAVQGGGQVFSSELDEIEKSMSYAVDLQEYSAAAGRLQDFYAREIPAIALYWDSFVYAYSDKLEGVFADAVFGINNVKNWSVMTKKEAD